MSNTVQMFDGLAHIGPANNHDLAPGEQVGEYVISQKIGEGGMATVYGAIHPIIAKRAAIKVLSRKLSCDIDEVDRFVQEARAVNSIGHPNIVDVFAFGQLADGRRYFIMEWLNGRTLEELLADQRPSLDTALDVLDQVCVALGAAHAKGIVHRDLKPANIFLVPLADGKWTVKLLDFGIAKLIAPVEGMPKVRETDSGMAVGTPEYISPEQARGEVVDGRTDLYSLGVTAYEMVLGLRPFEGDSAVEVMHMHVADDPPPPRERWPGIPPALAGLLVGLLAKSADDRPSLVEVRSRIEEVRRDSAELVFDGLAIPARAHATRTNPRIKSAPRRRPTSRIWLAASGLALVAAVTTLALNRTRAPAPAARGAEERWPEMAATPSVEPVRVPPVTARAPEHKSTHKHTVRPATKRDPDYLVNPFPVHH